MTARRKPDHIEKRLLTTREAAYRLGTSPDTLKKWPVPRRLRPDGRAVYDIVDLDRFSDTLPYEDDCEEAIHEKSGAGWEDLCGA